jgi:hypothetical protein
MSSPYRKFVGATQKKRIKQGSKCKTNRLASNIFLVLQKDRREGFAWIQLRLAFHQIWIPTLLFLSLTIRQKRNKTQIVCSVLVISLKTTIEKSGYDARNISGGHTLCAGMEEDSVC